MISAINSTPSFTGVVPVRVFVDGLETFDEKLIKTSCRQLSTILAGPNKTEPKLSLIKKFAQYDKDYDLNKGIHGYPKKETHKSIHPSEFFRCVIDRGRTFLITEPQAGILKALGKAIGEEKEACKMRGIKNSFDLMVAKRNYGRKISDFISSAKLRMTEKSENPNKWNPVTLLINMKSNEKYGLSTFKMKLDDINFIK